MLSTWFLRQMTPDSTMPWWQVNSSELDAQKKNRDHSGLGGTARSKCHCQHFCQGACAYVGLIREMVSATGLHASTEGTWLTQLPHDSGFRPPPMAAPWGCVAIPGCRVVFLSTEEWRWSNGSLGCMQSVERVTTLGLKIVSRGWSQWSQQQGLPF